MTPRPTFLRLALAVPLALSVGLPGAAQEPADLDPVTAGEARRLEESGVVERQGRLGESLLLIERQQRYAEALARLIDTLGPEARIEVAPGEFASFEETPAGLRARIELLNLRRQLLEAEAAFEAVAAPEEPETAAEEEPPVAAGDAEEILAAVDRRIAALRAELVSREGGRETPVFDTVALRAVYGAGARRRAVLQIGADRHEAAPGDILPGDVEVLEIRPDGVSLRRAGRTFDLAIGG